MLTINPKMLPRLDELEEDLLGRRERAIDEGWQGEIEGIDLTLTFLHSKRNQAHRAQTMTQGRSRRACPPPLVDGHALLPTANHRELRRELVPGPAVQQSTSGLGAGAADLLEEQGDALRPALVADVARPVQVELPKARAALPADDHPVDPGQVEAGQRPQQRLQR